jgi:hypothetical protein
LGLALPTLFGATFPTMRARVLGLSLTAVLSLAALVIGHNLVFLLTYGADYGVALARTGHDSRWSETVRVVLALAGLLLAAGAARLIWLVRLVRRLGRTDQDRRPQVAAYVRALLPLWARVFAIALFLYLVQENYERWSIGQPLPGLAVLDSSALVGPAGVFLLVSFAVAAVGALFIWGIAALEAIVEASRTRPPRSEECRRPRRPIEILGGVTSLLGRNLAGRAPPLCLPA